MYISLISDNLSFEGFVSPSNFFGFFPLKLHFLMKTTRAWRHIQQERIHFVTEWKASEASHMRRTALYCLLGERGHLCHRERLGGLFFYVKIPFFFTFFLNTRVFNFRTNFAFTFSSIPFVSKKGLISQKKIFKKG